MQAITTICISPVTIVAIGTNAETVTRTLILTSIANPLGPTILRLTAISTVRYAVIGPRVLRHIHSLLMCQKLRPVPKPELVCITVPKDAVTPIHSLSRPEDTLATEFGSMITMALRARWELIIRTVKTAVQ